MALQKIFTLSALISFMACGQQKGKTSTQGPPSLPDLPSCIVFGIFCGECSSHCATMYRYNRMGNANTLFVDSTDSYFSTPRKMVFNNPVEGAGKFQIVERLVHQIPGSFLEKEETGSAAKSNEVSERFGCPDCTDGCGIYFEMEQGRVVKKFFIDTNTNVVPKEIGEFAKDIKAALAALGDKN